MKKIHRDRKYAILWAMSINIYKIIARTMFSLLLLQNSAFSDTVITPYSESNGKIKTVGAGMIVIRDRGMDLTYQREVNNEYFGDVVMYKKNFFSRKTMQLDGRVESLDRMNAIVYTPVGKIEIQRYKIKDLIMKVPNKGY